MRRARATQLDQVRRCIESREFFDHGYRSPTEWLAHTTRESIGQCSFTIRLAERVQHMPHVRAAFAEGELAESALRLLTEAWHSDIADVFARDEEMLLGWALRLPHKDFKHIIDTWRMHADPDREQRSASDQYERRALHLSSMLDGLGRLDGTLDPEGLALVREAIRALSRPAEGERRTASQRRADALVDMARLTLQSLDHQPGKKRKRPKVIATVSLSDLESRAGGGVLDTNGEHLVVGAEAIRRLACDCGIHRYVTDPQGTVVDFGRQQRTVTDTLFDQLVVRDHGCRWPGCSSPPAACDAHHAIHWLDGGTTKPDHLALLCWHHHHLLHEQHWSLKPLGGGHFELSDPTGFTRPMRPPVVGLALPQDPPTLPLVPAA